MFCNHYQYIHIRSRSQLQSTLKLLHSKPPWARHGHPHKPLYKNRTTTLTHQTCLHLFFFFLTGTAVANPAWVCKHKVCATVWALRVKSNCPKAHTVKYFIQTNFFSFIFAPRRSQMEIFLLTASSLSISLTLLLHRDFGQVQTVGIFGISHHRWPRALALQRVQDEHEEIQEEYSGSLSLSYTQNQLKEQPASLGKTVRVNISVSIESRCSLRRPFPHQSALVWGFVALFHCWGPPRTLTAGPWS